MTCKTKTLIKSAAIRLAFQYSVMVTERFKERMEWYEYAARARRVVQVNLCSVCYFAVLEWLQKDTHGCRLPSFRLIRFLTGVLCFLGFLT